MKNIKTLNEEAIEKELLNKISKKEVVAEKVEKKEYAKEQLNEIEEIVNDCFKHFNMSSEEISKISQNKKIKKDYFNETFGSYLFNSFQDNNLNNSSKLSKFLIAKEDFIKTISINKKLSDLDISENFYPRIFKYLDNYRDIYLNNSDLAIRQNFMNTYLFHILNHVLKRKEEIEVNNKLEKIYNTKVDQRNNKLSKNKEIEKEFLKDKDEEMFKAYNNEVLFSANEYFSQYHKQVDLNKCEDFDKLKDQGFTTPRVLILLPYKKHAKLIMDEIVNILKDGSWKGIINKKKFIEEFNEVDQLGDCFRVGISFDVSELGNYKLKLYQPFEESDIILASPLGLKLADKVYDFLSSIEILLLDFSETFIFQNLEHLEEVFSFINRPPKNNQNIVNINRIKDNVKDNKLGLLRQNIIISHYKSLDIELLVKKYCNNIEGIYTMNEHYKNIISDLNLKEGKEIKFEFKMLKAPNDADIFDYKFNYFTKNVKYFLI
jgi:hypothetical protein